MGDDGLNGPAKAPQRRRALRNARMSRRWTDAREAVFFDELAATANVSHAAEQAGMSASSAHGRRARNAAFAANWQRALAVGYAELEMLLLRQAIQGAERTETVRDGDGAVKQTKTVHSFPHAIAMRLLQSHRESVERFRAMTAVVDGSDEQSVLRIRAELARVRARLAPPVAGAESEACDPLIDAAQVGRREADD